MTVLYSWTALQFLEARRGMYGYMHSTTTTPRRAWGDLQSTSHARRCYSLVARAWHHTPDLLLHGACAAGRVKLRPAGRLLCLNTDLNYVAHLTHVRAIGVDC